MTQKDLKESRGLYYDIDDCITKLLKARTEKDQEAEGKALFRMEGLMVGTLQHLAYLIEREEKKLPEGLEEAAEKASKAWRRNEDGSESKELFPQTFVRGFIAGAKWQAEQMMEKAVEKDLALTWEDLRTINDLFLKVDAENSKAWDYEVIEQDLPFPYGQKFYEEVLRRFREMKDK